MKVLVTGGAGFIGSALIRFLISETDSTIFNLDALTYAAAPGALDSVEENGHYNFIRANICEKDKLRQIFFDVSPDAVIHLAAESHVDRSIDSPSAFIGTNVIGTCNLLEVALEYWSNVGKSKNKEFKFLHVSTDEVYGSLGVEGLFNENSPYKPNSPYSASKASSDHFVRAWNETYNLPTIITNCSNNYGPFQFPEKLIPLMIINGVLYKPLPVYGTGENVRDWLHVDDHARALWSVLCRGKVGQTYNIGGGTEMKNISVVNMICDILDESFSSDNHKPRRELISFVQDRPGHDYRYGIDITKIKNELNWSPQETFKTGLEKTVRWYLKNDDWWKQILDNSYDGGRLGLSNDRNTC